MIKRVVQCDFCDAEAEQLPIELKRPRGMPGGWVELLSHDGELAQHLCPNHEITPKKPYDYNFGPNKCTTCGLTYAACRANGNHPTT